MIVQSTRPPKMATTGNSNHKDLPGPAAEYGTGLFIVASGGG